MKKIVVALLSCLVSGCALAGYAAAMESTPFKVLSGDLIMTADVINFAYNCVQMEDGSTIYDVISNSYAKTGSMPVTIHCLQYKAKVVLPLTAQDNRISTPISTYPVKFSALAPVSCRAITSLTVANAPEFSQGYTLSLH